MHTISFRFLGKVMAFSSYVVNRIKMLYLSTFVILLWKWLLSLSEIFPSGYICQCISFWGVFTFTPKKYFLWNSKKTNTDYFYRHNKTFNNILVTYASVISKKAAFLNWVKPSWLEEGTDTDSFLQEDFFTNKNYSILIAQGGGGDSAYERRGDARRFA